MLATKPAAGQQADADWGAHEHKARVSRESQPLQHLLVLLVGSAACKPTKRSTLARQMLAHRHTEPLVSR